jgi:starch synthase
MIGRLDPQKGFDLLSGATPALLERGVRVDRPGQRRTRRWPARSGHSRGVARRGRAHRALRPRDGAAGSMPARTCLRDASRFEPCGQGQMIALRYGTPPIVHRDRRSGRHRHRRADQPGRGTGFSFTGRPWRACSDACDARVRCAAAGPAWSALLDRGMAVDFDWVTGSAPRYVEAIDAPWRSARPADQRGAVEQALASSRRGACAACVRRAAQR